MEPQKETEDLRKSANPLFFIVPCAGGDGVAAEDPVSLKERQALLFYIHMDDKRFIRHCREEQQHQQ
jgi:hypothetical protein